MMKRIFIFSMIVAGPAFALDQTEIERLRSYQGFYQLSPLAKNSEGCLEGALEVLENNGRHTLVLAGTPLAVGIGQESASRRDARCSEAMSSTFTGDRILFENQVTCDSTGVNVHFDRTLTFTAVTFGYVERNLLTTTPQIKRTCYLKKVSREPNQKRPKQRADKLRR